MEASSVSLPPAKAAVIIVTGGLGIAAAFALAFQLLIGFAKEDTNHLETALILATGRQFTEGPDALYGPYGGSRLSPLIHAPLFYRIAGLAAWPLWAGGSDPLTASLIAGRVLAFGSTIALLILVYKLGRLPGAPAISGVWAALIVASSVTMLNFPVSVRSDLMGLAFQTGGFLCAINALGRPDHPWRWMIGAGLAFAVAACLKQHDIGMATAAYLGLLVAWTQGRFRLAPILASGVLAVTMTLAYYGIENVVTRGALYESAFQIPSRIREVLPGGWPQVVAAWKELVRESAPILILGAIAFAAAPRVALGGILEIWLGVALLIESALSTFCFAGSEGAWTNYAFQAIVLTAILIGRGLGRLFQRPMGRLLESPRAWANLAVVAVAVLLLAANTGWICARRVGWRYEDRQAWAELVQDKSIAPFCQAETYVGSDPGYNRLYGRPDLTHDEWAYSVVERLGKAPVRSEWLREAIEEGPIHRIVLIGEAEGLPGIPVGLSRLGYRQVAHHGRFHVWDRR